MAIDAGVLKQDSVLGYTAMVGNKGFDPFALAGEGSDETKLNGYREAGANLLPPISAPRKINHLAS
jgi:hypothetical protein